MSLHNVTARVRYAGDATQHGKRITLLKNKDKSRADTFAASVDRNRFDDVRIEPAGSARPTVAEAHLGPAPTSVGAVTDTTTIQARYPNIAGTFLCFPCRAYEIPRAIYGTPDDFEQVIATHDEPIGRGATRCAAGDDLMKRNGTR